MDRERDRLRRRKGEKGGGERASKERERAFSILIDIYRGFPMRRVFRRPRVHCAGNIIILCSEMNNGNYYRNTVFGAPRRDIKTILCAHFMHNE